MSINYGDTVLCDIVSGSLFLRRRRQIPCGNERAVSRQAPTSEPLAWYGGEEDVVEYLSHHEV